MKCRICGKKAVVCLSHHKLALCKEHYPQWFKRQVLKTISEFKMFSKNERILVAVSGGKDSLSLWKVLVELGYKVVAFHIDLGISGFSEKARQVCEEFARTIGSPLIVYSVKENFGFTIEEVVKKLRRKDYCSVCGTFKRYIMNRFAVERNFSAVATGHNLDDESAQLLSNVLRWDLGYLGRQFPVLPKSEGFAKKVKPFAFLTEKEIVSYAVISKIPFFDEPCPYAREATSPVYKRALAMLEHEMPGTKLRFYKQFLKSAKPLFEKEAKKEVKLEKCEVCGMLTSAKVCSVCRIVEKVKNAESRKDRVS